MKRIGLIGLGHLGKIHLKCLKETDFEIVGFYDDDETVVSEIPKFQNVDELFQSVDAIDIVCSTSHHLEYILKAIEYRKHIFVEKPICDDLKSVEIIKSKMPDDLILQVGHVERFNPAFIPLKGKVLDPMFIEAHRIASFNPRGTDVSVVLDLMIHDLDIINALVDAEVESIDASGVSIVSKTPDIANARIKFKNGCVANLTASRISLKQMRKMRIFAKDAYVSIDFSEKDLSVIKINDDYDEEKGDKQFPLDTPNGKKYVYLDKSEITNNNAILEELKSFYRSITKGSKVEVGLEEAFKAQKMAIEIIAQIRKNELKYLHNEDKT